MDISELNILVSGGCGFIGSNIVDFLLKNGAKFVRVVDNLSTGTIDNISDFLHYKNFEFVQGDLSNLETCDKVLTNIDVICHQAALCSVTRSIINPFDTHNSNVNGFFNLLYSAKLHGIKRFVYASSSSVYGDIDQLPKIEDNIGNHLSPYAITKYVDELYANIFYKLYDMECIGLRYFNVFGPKQNNKGPYAAVIPLFIEQLNSNDNPIINGDGSQSRDFTYVANVVQANILAITTKNKDCFGQVFNIGAEQRTTIYELYQLIKTELKSDCEPIFRDKRIGDIQHSLASIEKAKKLLHYSPKIKLLEGIKMTINYFLKVT